MRNGGSISGGKVFRRRKKVCRLGRRWRWKFSLARNLRKRENIGVGMRKVSVAVGLALVGGVDVVWVRNGCTGRRRRWKFLGRNFRKRRNIGFGTRKVSKGDFPNISYIIPYLV